MQEMLQYSEMLGRPASRRSMRHIQMIDKTHTDMALGCEFDQLFVWAHASVQPSLGDFGR